MKTYAVQGQFVVEAQTAEEAENIVQNAVEATGQHVETVDVTAELDCDDDGEGE